MVRTIILIILLAVFNIVFFLLNTVNNLSYSQWITYGFVNCGIALPFLVSIIPICKPEIKASVVSIMIVYGVMELIIGITLLACQVKDITWPLIIQLVMMAIAFILSLGIYTIDKKKSIMK